ncbi:hypothetical protein ACFLUV_01260 [Elusimicrobiota bacterium]
MSLKVPENHRDVLIEPSRDKWPEIIKKNKDKSRINKPYMLGCGHQSTFFHPGVLFKEIAVNSFKNISQKANIVCDTEIPENVHIKLPQGTVNLKENTEKVPYCRIPPLSEEEITQSQRYLDSKFFKTMLELTETENFAGQLTNTKEIFLKKNDFSLPQVYLSDLLATYVYQEFYNGIEKRRDEFIEIYNRSLDEISYQTGIRKLEEEELPFWERDNIKMPVPKAIPLSIFFRLYLFDLYVEGVGGSHYRMSADYIIENFYKEVPPQTAVASATLWYKGEGNGNLDKDIFVTQEVIRRMQENPQEFTGNAKDINEIEDLIGSLNISDEKAEIHDRIKQKKKELISKIEDKLDEKKNKLEELKRQKDNNSREYPYFIYTEDDIKQLFKITS